MTPSHKFEPATFLTRIVQAIQLVIIILAIVIAVLGASVVGIAHRLEDLRFLFALRVIQIISLAGAAAFFGWIYKTHSNLQPLSAPELKFSSAQTVRLCLIPFVNIFMVFFVMLEIWQGSKPVRVGRQNAGRNREIPLLLCFWWIVGCGGWLGGLILSFLAVTVNSAGDFRALCSWLVIDVSLIAVHAALFIPLVGIVNRNQSLRLKSLQRTADKPSPSFGNE